MINKESVNKKGQKVFNKTPSLIAILTGHGKLEKLKSKGIQASNGTLMALTLFFINYITEYKMALCVHKLCLITRLLLDAMMREDRKSGGEIFKSLTQFFQQNMIVYYQQNRMCHQKMQSMPQNETCVFLALHQT